MFLMLWFERTIKLSTYSVLNGSQSFSQCFLFSVFVGVERLRVELLEIWHDLRRRTERKKRSHCEKMKEYHERGLKRELTFRNALKLMDENWIEPDNDTVFSRAVFKVIALLRDFCNFDNYWTELNQCWTQLICTMTLLSSLELLYQFCFTSDELCNIDTAIKSTLNWLDLKDNSLL